MNTCRAHGAHQGLGCPTCLAHAGYVVVAVVPAGEEADALGLDLVDLVVVVDDATNIPTPRIDDTPITVPTVACSSCGQSTYATTTAAAYARVRHAIAHQQAQRLADAAATAVEQLAHELLRRGGAPTAAGAQP